MHPIMGLARPRVRGLRDSKLRVILLQACYAHSAANGTLLYARGCGVFGALGTGNLNDADGFVQVDTESAFGRGCSIKQLSAGMGHSVILLSDGRLFLCGRPFDFSVLLQINRVKNLSSTVARIMASHTNFFGTETGSSAMTDMSSNDRDGGVYVTPRLVRGINDKVIFARASAGLTVALTDKGEVFSLGLNRWGQCGVSDSQAHIYYPTKLCNFPSTSMPPTKEGISSHTPTIVAVDIGLQHGIALSKQGNIYTWGKGLRGQLGDGKLSSSSTPVAVNLLVSEKNVSPPISDTPTAVGAEEREWRKTKKSVRNLEAVGVSAGFNHTAAITADGAIYLWGKGMSETLKRGSANQDSVLSAKNLKVRIYEDQATPRRIELPEGRKAIEICCSNFTLAIRADDNSLWAMGIGEHDRNTISVPLRVLQAVPEGAPLSEQQKYATCPPSSRIAKGYQRVCILPKDGQISELIIHEGEAFLQWIDDVKGDASDIADYSAGWQHILLAR